MIRYKQITVPSGNNRNLTNALAGLGERDRLIRAFWFSPRSTNFGINEDTVMEVFLEQDQIVEFPINPFITVDTDTDAENTGIKPRVEINLEIKAGQGLQAGTFNASQTNHTMNLIMEYEDK